MESITVRPYLSAVTQSMCLLAMVLCAVNCSKESDYQAQIIRSRERIRDQLLNKSSLVSSVKRLFTVSKMTAYEMRGENGLLRQCRFFTGDIALE